MKRAHHPLMNDSKSFQCITQFELIPPNLIAKDNPIFSAFSKHRFKKIPLADVHDHRNNRSDHYAIPALNPTEQKEGKSMLLGPKKQSNPFEGLLKARRSHIKKLKLKQFYVQEYDQNAKSQQQSNTQSEVKIPIIQSKNSTQFNTIDSAQMQGGPKNFFLPSRKKLLPAKLRAKSYSNIPRSMRQQSLEVLIDERSLYIKAKKSLQSYQNSVKITIQHEIGQNIIKTKVRRNLYAGKSKKTNFIQENNSLRALEDISSKMNEQSIELGSEEDKKKGFQRGKKQRRGLRSQYLSKIDSIADINPWANNDDDKENQLFVYM